MKKILLSLLLTMALTVSFTACGSSDTSGTDSTGEETTAVTEATEEEPKGLVDEDGNILEGYTSGTENYEFITYGKPLCDKEEDDDDGNRTYTIYLSNEDTGEEETMMISLYYHDFTSEGGKATCDGVKEVLLEDGVEASTIKDMTIDGADAIQYSKQVSDNEMLMTSIFHDGNYMDVVLYSVDRDPSEFARDIYKEVIDSITITK